MAKRVATVAVVSGLIALICAPARAQIPSIEEQLLALINSSRSHPVVMHAGLRAVARDHAAAMAAAGKISHRRVSTRIFSAAPDPPERGGPPDRGFTNTWCEVAGWEPNHVDENMARRFFDDWQQKPEDNDCMTNGLMTVTGIGVYQQGQKMWATLEMMRDRTPPRASAGAANVPPQTTSALVANQTPAATSDASSSTSAAPRTSTSSDIGWREIFVSLAGFSVVPLLAVGRRRRRILKAREAKAAQSSRLDTMWPVPTREGS